MVRLGRRAPEAMAKLPSLRLARLAAILGFATTAALGELAWIFLPFAADHASALSNPAARVVLPACVAHDDAGPVGDIAWEDGWRVGEIHLGGMRAEGESLYEREDIGSVIIESLREFRRKRKGWGSLLLESQSARNMTR